MSYEEYQKYLEVSEEGIREQILEQFKKDLRTGKRTRTPNGKWEIWTDENGIEYAYPLTPEIQAIAFNKKEKKE